MIELDRLIASALGELAEPEDAVVEEHVLSCDACAELYASFVRLGPAIGALLHSGRASLVITRSLVDRLEEARLISRRYRLAPNAIVPCSVSADDIYSLATFEADLRGTTRVDMIRAGERVRDVPFDPADGNIYLLTPSAIVRTLPSMKIGIRLLAVEETGERSLGDYTLDHTAFRS